MQLKNEKLHIGQIARVGPDEMSCKHGVSTEEPFQIRDLSKHIYAHNLRHPFMNSITLTRSNDWALGFEGWGLPGGTLATAEF